MMELGPVELKLCRRERELTNCTDVVDSCWILLELNSESSLRIWVQGRHWSFWILINNRDPAVVDDNCGQRSALRRWRQHSNLRPIDSHLPAPRFQNNSTLELNFLIVVKNQGRKKALGIRLLMWVLMWLLRESKRDKIFKYNNSYGNQSL